MVADIIYNCSTDCECYLFTNHNLSKIDCSKRNLNDTSTIIPAFKTTSTLINLVLRDNVIEVLPNLTNIRIASLNICNNSITTLDANLLPKSLKVS